MMTSLVPSVVAFKPSHVQWLQHLENSKLICSADQLADFYMMVTLIIKSLRVICYFALFNTVCNDVNKLFWQDMDMMV